MSVSKLSPICQIIILLCISLLCIGIRLFSVIFTQFIRYESIIHEFDPWFNYRATQVLQTRGLVEFWDWFDDLTWYPLGRAVGATVYPGMMITSHLIERVLSFIGLPLDIRNVCVFLAPGFSALTALASYLLTFEITGKSETGLLAALFTGICPAYISRSVAGSYDNEAVSIFAMIFTFFLYVKSLNQVLDNQGSMIWGGLAALSYFYMVSSWGGYVFIINVIPIFVLGSIFTKQYSVNLYISYSTFYILANILAVNIQFVGTNVVESSEHVASHAVFFTLQVYALGNFLRHLVGDSAFKSLLKALSLFFIVVLLIYSGIVIVAGKVKWSLRSLTLLNPTYADYHAPLIESVSEHNPTSWIAFFTDLQFLLVFAPAGLFYCFKEHSPAKLFLAVYALLSVYFASVMVRLLLVLAPAVSILAAVGISESLYRFTRHVRWFWTWIFEKKEKTQFGFPIEISLGVIGLIALGCVSFISHSIWISSENYSNPQIYLSSWYTGERNNVDDFREAYYWMRMNTAEDSKFMAWWDYGYQITGNANRSVLLDNNTWNNSHIATIGMIFASNEEDAARYLKQLDTDYVFVGFGGFAHYLSDDIGKFYWMIRIAADVFPFLKVDDYEYRGSYQVYHPVPDALKQSLIYRLSYYRFGEVGDDTKGFDRVREAEIGYKDFKLKRFEEVFTSQNWIVRIFRVLPENNRQPLRASSTYSRNDEEMEKHGLCREFQENN
jgi:dolichyl-diphosphooligosaccharide--protein glycosyltransferase